VKARRVLCPTCCQLTASKHRESPYHIPGLGVKWPTALYDVYASVASWNFKLLSDLLTFLLQQSTKRHHLVSFNGLNMFQCKVELLLGTREQFWSEALPNTFQLVQLTVKSSTGLNMVHINYLHPINWNQTQNFCSSSSTKFTGLAMPVFCIKLHSHILEWICNILSKDRALKMKSEKM